MESVKKYFEALLSDLNFFKDYQNNFVENFSRNMYLLTEKNIPENKLKSVAATLYKKLFSLDGDYRDEFYNLGKMFAEQSINIKPVFTKSFLLLIRDYTDYTIKNGKNLENFKNLIGLIDLYLQTIDKAYSDYTKHIEKELEIIKEESTKKDTENIVHILKLILKDKTELIVFSYYKEVPILMKFRIKEIGKDYFILDISKTNIDLKKLGNSFYQKHKLLPKTVKSFIKKVDTEKQELILDKFLYVDLPQENRKYIRVYIDERKDISIKKGNLSLEGIIYDISINGVGIIVNGIKGLKIDENVLVKFKIENDELKIKGQVKNFKKRENGYKVGIKLYPEIKEEDVISEYIAVRQIQILKEIR